jgi:hypothetical protein
MATVNKRSKLLLSNVINGVTAGGATVARIDAGYDEIVKSTPDGLQIPFVERATQFVRGSQTWECWAELINLLTGTVGSSVFYERKSGIAAATGYVKHQINNPVIYRANLNQSKGQYMTATAEFECRFASETAIISDVWAMTDSQAAPTFNVAARGGWRIISATFTPASSSAINLYHLLSFNFSIALALAKASNDSDKGYTAVDADLEAGVDCSGSLTLEDSTVASSVILAAQLLLAARGTLVLTVAQGAGAANKTITINGVQFGSGGRSLDAGKPFNDGSIGFTVTNNSTTPLTLAGANKIIAIA